MFLDDEEIAVRTGNGSKLAAAVNRAVVAFQVDSLNHTPPGAEYPRAGTLASGYRPIRRSRKLQQDAELAVSGKGAKPVRRRLPAGTQRPPAEAV